MYMVTNGFAFMDIKQKSPIFRDEPFKVKILLGDDGVNLFTEMTSIYLEFLLFLLNNNFPSWMSINKDITTLSLIARVSNVIINLPS
jgi:hypothetical protein